ncbi:hypothetical protein V5T82_16335 [Magnetovibrio sp. PR-2]|uniref:hypothetical protein n=1 Tax=Magnetovibrio sp. PR-2 TaxID=3120356 RepID=UPI002FCE1E6A
MTSFVVDSDGPMSERANPAPASIGETGQDASRATQTWKILGQTTPKPINDRFERNGEVIWRQNEDRFHLSETEDTIVAAVADGAGSSGMFCGAWADALVDRLPHTPIADVKGLNDWVDGFWKAFSDSQKQRAQNDPVKLNKFVREGSCSTLTACWISKKTATGVPVLNWLCYGDSHLCVFDKKSAQMSLEMSHPVSLSAMMSDPYLLNWKDLPQEQHVKAGQVELTSSSLVVLASDGIGEYVHLSYLADLHERHGGDQAHPLNDHSQGLLTQYRQLLHGGNSKLADLALNHSQHGGQGFSAAMQDMENALQAGQTFGATVEAHHGNGLLPNDDSTLIMIHYDCEDDATADAAHAQQVSAPMTEDAQ